MFEKWFKASGFGPTERPYLEACWRDAQAIALSRAVLLVKKKQKEIKEQAKALAESPQSIDYADLMDRAKVCGELCVALAEMPAD